MDAMRFALFLGPPQLANSLLCLLIRLARLDDRRRGYPEQISFAFCGHDLYIEPQDVANSLDKTCVFFS